jgi:hypothetical protein
LEFLAKGVAMFEDMWDENDLEFTENRLRVHVLSLKKQGDPYPLMRLYGPLSLVLARRGRHLAAQDALNDAEFLIVEHGWRGTEKEAWMMCDRAKTMMALGRDKLARRSLHLALELAADASDPELGPELEALTQALELEGV